MGLKGLLLAAIYTLSPNPDSRIELEIYKTGFMSGKKHVFVFSKFRGEAGLDPPNVHVFIDAAAARCIDTWVKEKDRQKIEALTLKEITADGRYPEMEFRSTKVAREGSRYEIHGELTIRGIAKPALLIATVEQPLKAVGTALIRLSDYGIKPPGAALGTIGTKNEMTVRFRLTAR